MSEISEVAKEITDLACDWRNDDSVGYHDRLRRAGEIQSYLDKYAAAEKTALEQTVRELREEVAKKRTDILAPCFCGVSGHFKFQQNGNSCLMCQKQEQAVKEVTDDLRRQLAEAQRRIEALIHDLHRSDEERDNLKQQRDAAAACANDARRYAQAAGVTFPSSFNQQFDTLAARAQAKEGKS